MPSRRLRPSPRIAMIAALLLLLLAVLPVASLWFYQDAFLFPARHNDHPVAASGLWQVGHVDVAGTGRLAFLFADAGGSAGAPVLLYLHGNGSAARFAATDTEELVRAGLPVVIAEYPGYSGNPGLPSERSLAAAAEATAAWARARWPDRRLAVLGESIGSAPAVHLAARGGADLLVLDSGFTSMTAAIRVHLPWLPMAGLLNRHPMDNIGTLRAAAGRLPPALVMISAADPVVPAGMGEALAAAIPCSTLLRSDWSGHAVLHGDPRSRGRLLRWLLQPRDGTCPSDPS